MVFTKKVVGGWTCLGGSAMGSRVEMGRSDGWSFDLG